MKPLSPETRQRIQILLALALAIAAIRVAIIFYERHAEKSAPEKPAEQPLNPDYYVVPKKLLAYDLKSAQKLVGQAVWVREGYRSTTFAYDPATHRCDFRQQAGPLLPIERLEVKDVVRQNSPLAPGQPQIMVVFEKEGKYRAFSVGAEKDGNYSLYIDDMLYLEDPHQLYKHWPAETWKTIDQHQARLGMSELQVGFALGVGYLHGSGLGSTRTLTYPNGGQPLVITFEEDKAVDIHPAPPEK